MRIVVIGATGQTGGQVVQQALAAGHQVVAYTRHPDQVQAGPGLEVREGHLEDATRLVQALAGADAVLVAIGPRSLGQTSLMRRTLPHVVGAMKRAGVRRLVLLSAMGVGDSAAIAQLPARTLYRTLLRKVYRDKVLAEPVLHDPAIDVTQVLPVMLTEGPDQPDAAVVPLDQAERLVGLPKVSRGTVARVMLAAAEDDTTISRRLVVSAPGTVR